MKKMVGMLTLGLVFLALPPVSADDTPHMDFVKALRAKNYTDLAFEYLDYLEKSGPADVKDFIPLERAKIKLDQATSEPDINKRTGLYEGARGQFETFAKAKAGTPLAALAKMESTQILTLQARALQTKARGLQGPALVADMGTALDMFQRALGEYEKTGDEIDKLLKKDQQPKMLKALETARLAADLESAVSLIDQATCYEALNKQPADLRGKMIDKAIKDLTDLHGRDPKGVNGSLAWAYAIRGNNEIDQTKDAKGIFDKLVADNGAYADSGKRMGRFFYLTILTGGRNLAPLGIKQAELSKEVQRLAEEWIRLYPAHLNTAEGIQVRFELANHYRNEGKAFPLTGAKKDQLDARAKPLYEKALVYYRELDEAETEFSNEVRAAKLDIMLGLSDNFELKREDIPLLKTFDDCHRNSQIEATRIAKDEQEIYDLENKKPQTDADLKKLAELKKTLGDRRKKHLTNVQELLLRALALADTKTKPKDIIEVRSTLAYVLMANDHLEEAAVIGEHLAKTNPDSTKAAQGAAYALQAYAQIIANGTKEGLPKEVIDVDRARFKKLVEYMENTWKDDPATDAARHQVGTQLLRDKNFREAEKVLSRVSAAYAAASRVDARYWWAVACQEILKDKVDDKEKEYYHQQLIKALRGVPDLGANVPQEVSHVYVRARLQLGGILFESKQYAELDTLADQLLKRIPSLKLDEEDKDNYKRTAEALSAYGKFGRANQELTAGQYLKALELCDNVLPGITKQLLDARKAEAAPRKRYDALIDRQRTLIDIMKDLDEKEKKELDALKEQLEHLSQSVARDAELFRALSLVALRACVLSGNNARARQIITKDLPETLGGSKIDPQIYVQLVAQIRKQIQDLKDKNDKDKLKKLVDNFEKFLDNLRDEINRAAKPDVILIFFVANAYSGLDRAEDHVKAAELVGKIPEPKAEPPKKVDPQQEKMYHAARLMYARELRMGKKFPEARKVLDEILGKEWGKGFEVRREVAFCWQDEEKYGAAAKHWSEIIGSFGAKPDFSNAKLKENYFESRYQYIYCLYMYAKNIPANDAKLAPKKPEYVKRAATLIVQLESAPPGDMGGESFKKRYEDLLKKEDVLKKEYDTVKKEKDKEKPEEKKTN